MEPVHELATETDKRLSVHEAVCATRYEGIQARFDEGPTGIFSTASNISTSTKFRLSVKNLDANV